MREGKLSEILCSPQTACAGEEAEASEVLGGPSAASVQMEEVQAQCETASTDSEVGPARKA